MIDLELTKEEETAIRLDINAIRRDMAEIKVILEELSTIKEMVTALQFQSADKLQQAKQPQQKPVEIKPAPHPAEKKVESPKSDVEQWIPLREELEAFKQEWKESQYGWSAFTENYPSLAEAIRKSYQGKLTYGDMYLKLGGDEEQYINLNESGMKNSTGKPTEAQVNYATKLGIDVPVNVTKGELSVLIAEYQLAERRSKL